MFRTMYPYLQLIAEANGLADPFDEQVVEAYWIGNRLLEAVGRKPFYRHLSETLGMRRRIGGRAFNLVTDKLAAGALPHHSFHVFDIWKRTGNTETEHTLESMDSCRISWGRVTAVDGPSVTLLSEPLLLREGKLTLGEPVPKTIRRGLDCPLDLDEVRTDDILTYHWGSPCEVIDAARAADLKRYTLHHVDLANRTI